MHFSTDWRSRKRIKTGEFDIQKGVWTTCVQTRAVFRSAGPTIQPVSKSMSLTRGVIMSGVKWYSNSYGEKDDYAFKVLHMYVETDDYAVKSCTCTS